MSLDGFIADPDDDVPFIFDWYGAGDVVTDSVKSELTFRTSQASAEHIRRTMREARAMVVGRRLFDITNGWGGQHPFDVPIFVVTHNVPTGWEHIDWAPFTFVTTGVKDAIEQAKQLGDVWLGGASITQQALNEGLVDEIRVNLAPVLLGAGIRWFDNIKTTVELDDPVVVESTRVTHLYYKVRH